MTVTVPLGSFGVPGLPGPIRGALGRRRERVVVLRPAPATVASLPAPATVTSLPATWSVVAWSVVVPAALPRRPALPALAGGPPGVVGPVPPGLRR